MLEIYKQILLSHMRKFPLWYLLIIGAMLYFSLRTNALLSPQYMKLDPEGYRLNLSMTLLSQGFLMSLVTGFCCIQIIDVAKKQMATPDAKLTPGFRWPHLVVAGSLFVSILVGVSLLFSWRTELSFPATLGLMMGYALLLVWETYLRRSFVLSPMFYIPFVFQFAGGSLFLKWYSAPDWIWIAVLILDAGAVLVLGRRLWMLSEDMPEYPRLDPNPASGIFNFHKTGNTPERLNYESWWTRTFMLSSDEKIAKIVRERGVTLWSRLRRTQVSIQSSALVFFVLFCFLILNVTIARMSISSNSNRQLARIGLLALIIPNLYIYIVVTIVTLYSRHKSWMAVDMLRPISRGPFFRERLLALMLQQCELIALSLIIIGATCWYWDLPILNDRLCMILGYSIAGSFLASSLGLWIARLIPSSLVTTVFSAGGSFVFIFLVIASDTSLLTNPTQILGPNWATFHFVALCLAGLGIAWAVLSDLERRWMTMELG